MVKNRLFAMALMLLVSAGARGSASDTGKDQLQASKRTQRCVRKSRAGRAMGNALFGGVVGAGVGGAIGGGRGAGIGAGVGIGTGAMIGASGEPEYECYDEYEDINE